jgi:hypothetical protein
MPIELKTVTVALGEVDDDGDTQLRAVAELRNQSDDPCENLEIKILLRDGSGELVGVATEMSDSVLAPGAVIAVSIEDHLDLGGQKIVSAECELEYRSVRRSRTAAKLRR